MAHELNQELNRELNGRWPGEDEPTRDVHTPLEALRRFHDLRHTAATLMLKAGVPLKVVSEMLGHTTIAITADVYGHVTADMQRDAARALQEMLARRA